MDIKLKKRRSKIDNIGIFTINPIPKNVEFYKIPLKIIYSEPKLRCARIADGKYIYDDKVLNWVNHSYSPNSKLDIDRPGPVLIAIRDILANEEVTVDYDKTEVKGIKIKCTCKQENCKGYFNKL